MSWQFGGEPEKKHLKAPEKKPPKKGVEKTWEAWQVSELEPTPKPKYVPTIEPKRRERGWRERMVEPPEVEPRIIQISEGVPGHAPPKYRMYYGGYQQTFSSLKSAQRKAQELYGLAQRGLRAGYGVEAEARRMQAWIERRGGAVSPIAFGRRYGLQLGGIPTEARIIGVATGAEGLTLTYRVGGAEPVVPIRGIERGGEAWRGLYWDLEALPTQLQLIAPTVKEAELGYIFGLPPELQPYELRPETAGEVFERKMYLEAPSVLFGGPKPKSEFWKRLYREAPSVLSEQIEFLLPYEVGREVSQPTKIQRQIGAFFHRMIYGVELGPEAKIGRILPSKEEIEAFREKGVPFVGYAVPEAIMYSTMTAFGVGAGPSLVETIGGAALTISAEPLAKWVTTARGKHPAEIYGELVGLYWLGQAAYSVLGLTYRGAKWLAPQVAKKTVGVSKALLGAERYARALELKWAIEEPLRVTIPTYVHPYLTGLDQFLKTQFGIHYMLAKTVYAPNILQLQRALGPTWQLFKQYRIAPPLSQFTTSMDTLAKQALGAPYMLAKTVYAPNILQLQKAVAPTLALYKTRFLAGLPKYGLPSAKELGMTLFGREQYLFYRHAAAPLAKMKLAQALPTMHLPTLRDIGVSMLGREEYLFYRYMARPLLRRAVSRQISAVKSLFPEMPSVTAPSLARVLGLEEEYFFARYIERALLRKEWANLLGRMPSIKAPAWFVKRFKPFEYYVSAAYRPMKPLDLATRQAIFKYVLPGVGYRPISWETLRAKGQFVVARPEPAPYTTTIWETLAEKGEYATKRLAAIQSTVTELPPTKGVAYTKKLFGILPSVALAFYKPRVKKEEKAWWEWKGAGFPSIYETQKEWGKVILKPYPKERGRIKAYPKVVEALRVETRQRLLQPRRLREKAVGKEERKQLLLPELALPSTLRRYEERFSQFQRDFQGQRISQIQQQEQLQRQIQQQIQPPIYPRALQLKLRRRKRRRREDLLFGGWYFRKHGVAPPSQVLSLTVGKKTAGGIVRTGKGLNQGLQAIRSLVSGSRKKKRRKRRKRR